jgi:SH3-like domain-containing protein
MSMQALVLSLLLAGSAQAQFEARSEYLSAATDEVDVHDGPTDSSDVVWNLWKYMPVEIIGYRGNWRQIRDLDGHIGWMQKEDLVKTRTVMVSVKEANLRKTRGGKIEWVLERGFSLRVFSTKGDWLEVSDLSAVSGWIHKSVVWGAIEPVANPL